MIRIAAVTENGLRLSSHFGRAPYFRVFSVEDGHIMGEETRPKPYHGEHSHDEPHVHLHNDMFAPIADCQVLLCGGMGLPAYEKAQAAGLEVLLTGGEIQAAVQAYLDGKIVSDLRRIHQQ
jgi:predicted Fe-Mo cluster-binding NifX family protein